MSWLHCRATPIRICFKMHQRLANTWWAQISRPKRSVDFSETNNTPGLIFTNQSVSKCPIFYSDKYFPWFLLWIKVFLKAFFAEESRQLSQTPISTDEPKVNDPVSQLSSSLFSSGISGECLISRGRCQNVMNGTGTPALKTCINF